MKQTLLKNHADLKAFYNASKKAYVFGDNITSIIFDDNKDLSWFGASIIAPNAEITMLHSRVTFVMGAGIEARSLSVTDIKVEGDIKLSLCLKGRNVVCKRKIWANHIIVQDGLHAKAIFACNLHATEVYAEKIETSKLKAEFLDCFNVLKKA